jgi:hypothetical protein
LSISIPDSLEKAFWGQFRMAPAKLACRSVIGRLEEPVPIVDRFGQRTTASLSAQTTESNLTEHCMAFFGPVPSGGTSGHLQNCTSVVRWPPFERSRDSLCLVNRRLDKGRLFGTKRPLS